MFSILNFSSNRKIDLFERPNYNNFSFQLSSLSLILLCVFLTQTITFFYFLLQNESGMIWTVPLFYFSKS